MDIACAQVSINSIAMALRNAQWGERKVTLNTMHNHKVDTHKFAIEHKVGGEQWKLLQVNEAGERCVINPVVQDLFDCRVLVRRTAVEYAESLIADLATLLKNRQSVLQHMNMTNINTASTKIIKDVIKCVNDTRQQLRSLRVSHRRPSPKYSTQFIETSIPPRRMARSIDAHGKAVTRTNARQGV
jgi:hypothetical protein